MQRFTAQILSLVLTTFSMNAFAQTSANPPPMPNALTASLGDLRVKINADDLLWSCNGIDYKGTVMGMDGSVYITVATIKNVGHFGSAHFLEVPGKPNEIEKEPIESLKMILDGKPIDKPSSPAEINGKVFRIERQSKIRDLDVDSTVEWRDNKAIEFVHIHANKDVELNQIYTLSFPWSPNMKEFMFGLADGTKKTGTFLPDDKKAGEGLEKTANWFATYDPETRKGGVAFLAQRPTDVETWFQYTDAPKIYRKLRMMCFVNQTMPKDFDGKWALLVGFFESDSADWKAAAEKCLADLKVTAESTKLP